MLEHRYERALPSGPGPLALPSRVSFEAVGERTEFPGSETNAAEMPGVRHLGRAPALDGLRAVAVLVVFASHVEVFLPIASLLVIPGGTVGLDPFFVLSGFLITALLLKEQSQTGSVRRWYFYKRRIVRLLPPLIFVLIANVIYAFATNAWNMQQIKSLLSVSFYYSNYYNAVSPNFFCANLVQAINTSGRFPSRSSFI